MPLKVGPTWWWTPKSFYPFVPWSSGANTRIKSPHRPLAKSRRATASPQRDFFVLPYLSCKSNRVVNSVYEITIRSGLLELREARTILSDTFSRPAAVVLTRTTRNVSRRITGPFLSLTEQQEEILHRFLSFARRPLLSSSLRDRSTQIFSVLDVADWLGFISSSRRQKANGRPCQIRLPIPKGPREGTGPLAEISLRAFGAALILIDGSKTERPRASTGQEKKERKKVTRRTQQSERQRATTSLRSQERATRVSLSRREPQIRRSTTDGITKDHRERNPTDRREAHHTSCRSTGHLRENAKESARPARLIINVNQSAA